MNNNQYCLVITTFSSEKEAKTFAESAIKAKLAACAQISSIQSIYEFENKFCCDTEWQLKLKTTLKRYEALSQSLKAQHRYKTPQIITIPIIDGDHDYLQWIGAQTVCP